MPRSLHPCAQRLLDAAVELREALHPVVFAPPVHTVYQPLDYAWAGHMAYVTHAVHGPVRTLFLGMNPGPWGMAQTGVPFGAIPMVRDWLGLSFSVERPEPEHPRRPITGLGCARVEKSGERLWGLFAEQWGTAEAFFKNHFVANYCPLVFMAESGANLTPDKLPAGERAPVEAACDAHLRSVMTILEPTSVVGVGQFAQKALTRVTQTLSQPPRVLGIIHPSPASPIANREWPERPLRQLREAGVWD